MRSRFIERLEQTQGCVDMQPEHRELIEQAIDALRIRDIMLFTSTFRRPTPPPVNTNFDARQQSKRQVKFVLGEIPGQSELRLLQVYVELGLRVTDSEPETPNVFFEIEANFMVEYEIRSEVSEDAIKLFADLNSVHNVWPFWRQHVFDIVNRGSLPQLEIPLFSGVLERPKKLHANG